MHIYIDKPFLWGICCEVYSYYEQAFNSCCSACYVLNSNDKPFLVESAIRFIPIMNKLLTVAVVSVMFLIA